ncbi:MAG: hypothetical protein K9L74_00535 [Candidatus Izimaplasma sp.]|nr:hypothetical protein [Candidatus Izimaplasma bacterium]
MKCLTNLNKMQIPNDVIKNYLTLYKSIGINAHNHRLLEKDYDAINQQTVLNNTYYFAKFFDIDVSDTRFKSLCYRDNKAKNNTERLVKNIRLAFKKIHDDLDSFHLLATEIQDLLTFLYKGILTKDKLRFRKLDKKIKTSLLDTSITTTRESLEQMIKLFNQAKNNSNYEISLIITAFYIDFIKIQPFLEKNEEIAILILYILLLDNGYEVYEYINFFEFLANQKKEFHDTFLKSSFNWIEGFAQFLPMHRYFLNISLKSYDRLNGLVRDYKFDKDLNKSDNVENTIYKLQDVFRKNDIRKKHPYISDSTINRTLRRLRDEGVIRPTGKGRSAKWIRLKDRSSTKRSFEQLDLKL